MPDVFAYTALSDHPKASFASGQTLGPAGRRIGQVLPFNWPALIDRFTALVPFGPVTQCHLFELHCTARCAALHTRTISIWPRR